MHFPTTTTTTLTILLLLHLLFTTHAEITCFPPPVPSRPPLATPVDCANAIALLRVGDKSHAPMHFTRQPNTGFRVPHRWNSRTCTIAIDVLNLLDEDDFAMEEVARAAAAISTACVLRGTGYGGFEAVGPKEVVFVHLYGRGMLREGWGVGRGMRNVSVDMLAVARGGTAVARRLSA